jgi:thiol-disulfide isomerase/thioredoxin
MAADLDRFEVSIQTIMQKIKLLLAALLVLTSICAMAQISPFTLPPDSIHISGKVIGFKAAEGDNFVKITINNLTGETKRVAFQVKADGTYDATIYQAFAGDIGFNYGDAYLSIYAEPGKHLVLNIIHDKLGRSTGYKDAFVAEGDLAAINSIMLSFQAAFDLHNFQHKADIGDKNQADTLFAARRKAQLNEELDFLNGFIKQSGIRNKVFEDWQRNQFIYAAAHEMLFFPFFGKLNKTINHNQLLSLIRQIPINNIAATANSAWYQFLRSLSSGIEIIVNINPAYDSLRKQNGYNPVPLYLDKIDQVANGLSKQILYYNIYRPQYHPDDITRLAGRYNTVIKDEYLKTLFDKKTIAATAGFAAYSIAEKLKSSKVSPELKARLIALFEKEKGNNLYLDFWGDWCGPCMMEMPNYPKLIAALDGKPLKFIFMTTYTTTQSMLAIKNKYDIKAEFINLNKDEVAIMNNVLSFHSYPSHFMVNKQGMVVSNAMGSISNQAGLEAVTDKLNHLLQVK